MRVFGFIFARGGSKGVPGKNIRVVSGKPLIGWAIEAALKSEWIEKVYVSTDDETIASVALQYGAIVPFKRPARLAADDSPEWLSWQHAVKEIQIRESGFDIFVSIPTTSPLRRTEDIDRCIKALIDDKKADAVITITPARRHPAFNMVVVDNNKRAGIAMPREKKVYRRQEAKDMYDITTVAYAARPQFVLMAASLFEGNVTTVMVPEERALDIDTPFDLKIAELLLNERK